MKYICIIQFIILICLSYIELYIIGINIFTFIVDILILTLLDIFLFKFSFLSPLVISSFNVIFFLQKFIVSKVILVFFCEILKMSILVWIEQYNIFLQSNNSEKIRVIYIQNGVSADISHWDVVIEGYAIAKINDISVKEEVGYFNSSILEKDIILRNPRFYIPLINYGIVGFTKRDTSNIYNTLIAWQNTIHQYNIFNKSC
jgi:hypothetical protein